MRYLRELLIEASLVAALTGAIMLLATQCCYAALSDCHDATCRITAADGSRGTGCCFERSRGTVYVLTNAHVATSAKVRCEFWRQGHRSRPITGRVIARSSAADAAIVALAESSFRGVLPAVVPLAERGRDPAPGATIVSVGCAQGAWATGFVGHVLGYRNGDLCFLPVPADGRSGSAIFDAGGTRIVGLLRARSAQDSYGIATSLAQLYRELSKPTAYVSQPTTSQAIESTSQSTQCGPWGCPVPRVVPPCPSQSGRIQVESPSSPDVWPTLPRQSTVDVTSPTVNVEVELAPALAKIDQLREVNQGIAATLVEIKTAVVNPPTDTDRRRHLNPWIAAAVVLAAAALAFVVYFGTGRGG